MKVERLYVDVLDGLEGHLVIDLKKVVRIVHYNICLGAILNYGISMLI